MVAEINRQDPEIAGQRFRNANPVPALAEQAMQDDQRRAITGFFKG